MYVFSCTHTHTLTERKRKRKRERERATTARTCIIRNTFEHSYTHFGWRSHSFCGCKTALLNTHQASDMEGHVKERKEEGRYTLCQFLTTVVMQSPCRRVVILECGKAPPPSE